jgi:uncharacterized membrane protein
MMRTAWLLSFVAIAAMIAISVYGASAIPEGAMVARHWNFAGEVDGYSPRNHVLIAMPALAAVVSIICGAVPYIDPRKRNIDASKGLLIVSWIGVLAVLAVTHGWVIFTAAHGDSESPPHLILYAVSALLIVIGNFVAKSRSNFFLGVRTPWTLSSEHAWAVANRAGGWMLVLTGSAAAAAGYFLDLRTGMLALVAGTVAAAVVSVAVSYFAWRSDKERQRA